MSLGAKASPQDAFAPTPRRPQNPQRRGPATPTAPNLLNQRRDDQPPIGLLPLAVGLDVVAALEVFVHDLALERAHRLELNRPAIVDRGLGSLVSRRSQRHRPALAITGGVDHDSQRSSAAAERDSIREVLDRVDRLSMMPDQQPEVLADELGADPVGLLLNIDARLDADSGRDPLEQLANALRGA